MKIIKMSSKMLSSNTYIITNDKKSIVIDPAIEAELLLNRIKDEESELEKIIYTHGHVDHIFYGDELKEKSGAKIYGHLDDFELYESSFKNGAILFGLKRKFNKPDFALKEDEIIQLGDLQIKVIHTPGHTMGSICLLARQSLFTGDTLFYESVGRTDLGTGDWDMLNDSIKSKLYTLNEDVKVYPGHGITSTIKHEKEHNAYVYQS